MSLVQCQLLEYAKLKLGNRLHSGTLAYSHSWTYLYRPATGECVGLMIDLDGANRVTFRVEEMLGDVFGGGAAKQMLRPGPKPTVEQRELWQSASDLRMGKDQ